MACACFLTWCAYLFLKQNHGRLQRIFICIAITGVILSFAYTDSAFKAGAFAAGCLVLAYSTHWLQSILKRPVKFSLRSRGWIKPICITTAWCLLCTVPAVYSCEWATGDRRMLLIISDFMLIAGLAIASDLRDAEHDTGHITTLPIKYSARLVRLCCALLFIASSTAEALLFSTLSTGAAITMGALVLSSLALLFFKPLTSRRPLHTALIDAFLCIRFAVPFADFF